MYGKLWSKLALAGVLMLTAAPLAVVGGGETEAAEPPVRIVFDGETLSTDADAFIRNGTTFVPFRALFERLGLSVDWNAATRTVTGKGGGTAITLRVGDGAAIVDGETMTLLEPPAIVGGRTFVPLRFVSEHAGAIVEWNGAERLVTVATGPSGAEREAAVAAAYEAYAAAANREDAAATLRSFHADSPLLPTLRSTMADGFERRDVRTTIESLVVDGVQGSTATLLVTERNVGLSGAFYVDNRAEMKVTMRQTSAGAWAIYDAETLSREWLSAFGPDAGGGQAAPEDEAAGRNTIAAYMEALNQEDVEAAMRLVHANSPMRAATEATLSWMFDTYDLTHELETVSVLERSGDELYVYTVQALRKQAGPKLADVRTESIHTLRRLPSGQWRLFSSIEGNTETLSIPQ